VGNCKEKMENMTKEGPNNLQFSLTEEAPMLTRAWQELEHRIDVCRVTCGIHIEHLELSKTFFSFRMAVKKDNIKMYLKEIVL
jgi:hypothetical protein